MLELVPKIEDIWTRQNEEVIDSAEKITLTIQNMISESSGEEIGVQSMISKSSGEKMGGAIMDKAYDELLGSFDSEYGSFPRNRNFQLRTKYSFCSVTGDAVGTLRH